MPPGSKELVDRVPKEEDDKVHVIVYDSSTGAVLEVIDLPREVGVPQINRPDRFIAYPEEKIPQAKGGK